MKTSLLSSLFLFAGNGESLPDSVDYWAYDEIYHEGGDCVSVYAYHEGLMLQNCAYLFDFVCEIH